MSSPIHIALQQANRNLAACVIQEARQIAVKSARETSSVIRKMDKQVRTEIANSNFSVKKA